MGVDQLITTWVPPRPPGIYAVISATGGAFAPSGLGVAAIGGAAASGPLGVPQRLGSPVAVENMSLEGPLVNAARNAALGGAIAFVCVRAGSGGAAATYTVGTVGELAANAPGLAGNNLAVVIRPVAGSTTQSAATAATAASAAVPPAFSASMAARVASGCEVAAMPSCA